MLKCYRCGNSSFEIKNLRFEMKIKKQNVEVVLPCNICKHCNTSLMNDQQMNAFRKAAADKYRSENNLLTSQEIVAYREKLGLSQIGFARFLNVGEASIKRWETYYIQDESQNDHIRVKCDLRYSESNYFYLQSQYTTVDIYSGNKSFSAPLVREMAEFFKELHPECAMYLGKLHFYADFLHFKRHNYCITGMRYKPLKSGPAPHNYDQITNLIQSNRLDPLKTVHFDDDEKQTMQDIFEVFLQDKGKSIHNLSAQERGFLETDESEFISYEYSKDLLI